MRFRLQLSLLILLAWPLNAQQPDTIVQLTLEDAIQRAADNNPGFRQAQYNAALRDIAVDQAWLDLLPQLTVNVLQTGSTWNRTTVAEDFFGRPLENPETRTVQTSSSNQGASIRAALDLRDYLILRQRSAQSRVEHGLLQATAHVLRTDIKLAYLAVLDRQLALDLETDLLERAVTTHATTLELLRLAARGRIDVLAAELDVAEQEGRIERATAALETAKHALRNDIGDATLTNFTVVSPPAPYFDPAGLDEEALLRQALAATPRVVQQTAARDLELRNRSLAQAAWLPTVSFGFGTSRRSFVEGGGAFLDPLPGDAWDRNFTVALALPDLGQFLNRRLVSARSDLSIRTQDEALRQVRQDVEFEVRSRLVELRSAYRDIGLQERRAALAEERLALLQESSSASFMDLQLAANAAADARRQALQAQLSFARSRLALERVLGSMLPM